LLPGVIRYGISEDDAKAKANNLAMNVFADELLPARISLD